MKGLIVFFFLFSYLAISGQDGYLNFSSEDGFPSNTVYAILKDSRGILWIGTDNGLVRWDGSDFETYTVDQGLPSNAIWMLHQDAKDRIWILNSNDIRYYMENDSIKIFDQIPSLTTSEKVIYSDQGLQVLNFNERNHVGFDTIKPLEKETGTDLLRLNELKLISELHLKSLISAQQYLKYWSEDEIIKVEIIQYNEVFWIVDRMEDRVFRLKENQLDLLYSSEKDKITGRMPMPLIFNKKLIIDHAHGQLIIDLEKEELIESVRYQNPEVPINRFYQHSSGFDFLASQNHGLLVKSHLVPFELKALEGPVIDIEAGEENMIVKIGTQTFLMSIDENLDKPTELLSTERTTRLQRNDQGEILINDRFNIFLFDENNRKLNAFFDPLSHKNVHFDGENTSNTNLANWSKFLDLPNRKLFISNFWFLESDSTFQDFRGFRRRPLYDMDLWKDTLFIGSGNGLMRYVDRENYAIVAGTESMVLKRIVAFNDRCLLLLDNKSSLYRYDQGELHEIKKFDQEVVDLLVENDRLYILMKDRLEVMDPFTCAEENGFIWDLEILTAQSGFNCISANEESLFLGCNTGVISIKKENIKPLEFEPSMNELLGFSNEAILEQGRELNHKDNNIRFEFSATSIESMNKVSYEYRLIPGDASRTRTNVDQVTYPNLSPGHYRFELRAIDAFGNESATEYFLFRIAPPWYLTKEAILSFAVLLAALIYLWNRSKTIRIQKRTEEIIRFEKQKAVLQLTSIRSQMNPHFIFNTLTAIQDVIINRDPKEAEDHLAKFSRAIRLFLNYSRKESIVIREELELLKRYCELENIRFNNEIGIDWKISKEIDLDHTFVPTLLLQPLLENAINHGLFHKKGTKNLMVSADLYEEGIRFEIEDNGVGRKEAKKLGRGKKENHSSLGLTLVNERIEILNKINKFHIEFLVEDLYQDATPTGTKAVIKVKETE